MQHLRPWMIWKMRSRSKMQVFYAVILCLGLVFSMPAYAEKLGTEGEGFAKRQELAQIMHDIWPVRLQVEEALEDLALAYPSQQRAVFKSAMRKAIKYKELERSSVNAMAKNFSQDELQAMVNFYGSKVGRSISAKIDDYQQLVEPSITRMLDAALMDVKIGRGQ